MTSTRDRHIPPPADPADPRPCEVAGDAARAVRWLAALDLSSLDAGEQLELVQALAPVIDVATAVQVEALSDAHADDATVAREGLFTDAWLQLAIRRAGADRRTLIVAAEVLPTMPRLRVTTHRRRQPRTVGRAAGHRRRRRPD